MSYEDLLHHDVTQPAPANSFVVVADVRGSTQAIKAGKQRDVNLVGASCIAAVRNRYSRGMIPYVFGGDGATFLVPEGELENVHALMAAVQSLARTNLNISLRVGSVSVAELRSRNADVLVGYVSCGEEEQNFVLRGEGIALADRLVKERDTGDDLRVYSSARVNADVHGLSCRLLPFNSLRGHIYSIIVESLVPAEEQQILLDQLRVRLTEMGQLDQFRPLQSQNTRRRWLPKTWFLEGRYFATGDGFVTFLKSLLKALLENLLTMFVFKFNKANGMTGLPSDYTKEMYLQCDWMKMNGALYLILDMSDHESNRFVSHLDFLESQGKILYGMHRSSSALVVCHLKPDHQKQHFHFVDGSEGGLTFAATMLKFKKKNGK